MKLRHKDLARTLERSARRQRERAFDRVPTRDAYDRWAATYDDSDNPLIALEERELPALLGDIAGLEVVDIGCGTGRWSERLAKAGAQVTGVDFSAGMLSRARQRLATGAVEFVEHDLNAPLPFEQGRFDLVIGALVLDHIPDLPPLFSELARICRPGGRLVLTTMHPAMMLIGCQAEFFEPQSRRDVRPHSFAHQISDFVMASVGAGLTIQTISEHEVDEKLMEVSPKAAKWAGWPFLLLMIFGRPAG